MNSIMQPQNGKMQNSLRSQACEPKEKEIPRRPKKLPKWIHSKDVGKAKHAVLSNLLNWVQKLKTSEAEEVEVKWEETKISKEIFS